MVKNKSQQTATPIFILSTARSGTTSLSNHLCQHPEISCFKTKEHWGVHECSFISTWRYQFKNLNEPYNLFYFIESFKESDIFRLSKINGEIFYKKKPKNIIEFVKILIEEFCKRENTRFWLNNSPRQSFYIDELSKYFPDAYYIIIKRPIVPTVRSNIKRYKIKSLNGITKKVFRYRTDFDAINRHKDNLKNFIEIDFEDFINNQEVNLKNIIDFLGLGWDEKVLDNPYKIQSSFIKKDRINKYFNRKDEYFVNILNFVIKLLPFKFFKKPIRKKWDKKQAEDFINKPFYYRLHPYSKYMCGKRFHREDDKKD